MDFGELLRLLEQGGMVGLLLIIIVGGARRWWVFGWTYKDILSERDSWMKAALKGTNTVEKAADVSESSQKILDQAIRIMQRRTDEEG